MANEEQLAILKQGFFSWNEWRKRNPDAMIDLTEASLSEEHLNRANLSGADLSGADLSGANLSEADLSEADLSGAILTYANFIGAELSATNLNGALLHEAVLHFTDLSGANLGEANLSGADLVGADLSGLDLRAANFRRADLRGAKLCKANLSEADLSEANLSETDLSEAILSEAILSRVILIGTNFQRADLTECRIYGVSAWNVQLEGATQRNLIITEDGEPTLTVDDLEVAQFIYLMLNNQKIKNVIDTITSKAVLILGRFTEERKKVLGAIREELRQRGYVPILFDFEPSASRDLTETVTLLARMARFIIADLTDPKSIPQELTSIIPDLPSVPVQPIILSSQREYAMYEHWRKYPWVQEILAYDAVDDLLAELGDKVIAPSERAIEKAKAGSKASS